MMYEIGNPSDECTIEAPSDALAGVAILLLGRGRFTCTSEDNRTLKVLCMFGGDEVLGPVLDGLGVPAGEDPGARLGKYMLDHGTELAAVLDSVTYVSLAERKALLAAFEGLPDRHERIRRYNDEKRTSMNDISRAAHALAEQLRMKVETAHAE